MAPSNARSNGKGEEVNVQVIVRCRPPSEEEKKSRAAQVLRCNESTREVTIFQQVAGKQIDRTFTFDRVFGTATEQDHLFQSAIVPIVREVLEGFNCTIFAYGQTGTGKTYTMTGGMEDLAYHSRELDENAGVIPRAIKYIFSALESAEAEYSVKASFLELYNEEITDLLAADDSNAPISTTEKKLALMEDGKGGVLVRGLDEVIVKNSSEIYSILERGSSKRKTAETLLNKQSSRSHSVFTITLHIKESTPEGEELIKCGKLNLVDLAGSENISRSGAKDKRAREAGEINKSLLTLGRVISSLVEHQGHVPYRDSKLTRLLRDSLGGRTKTCIIATVAPSVNCYEETASTLDYAHRAKNIRNKPEVNQRISKHAMIKDLTTEIDRLKQDLVATREKNGVYISKERYDKETEERKNMEQKIEEMESDLEVRIKELEDLQLLHEEKCAAYRGLQDEHLQTNAELDCTKDKLSATQASLEEACFMVKERDFAIEKHVQGQDSMVQFAHSMRDELECTTQEVDRLHNKLERKQNIHQKNAETVDLCHETALERISSLEKALSTVLEKHQGQHGEAMLQLQRLLDEKQKSLACFHETVATIKGQIESFSSTMVAAVQKQCDSAVEGLENISDRENQFLKDMATQSHSLESILCEMSHNLDASITGHLDCMRSALLEQEETAKMLLESARGIASNARTVLASIDNAAKGAEQAAREAREAATLQLTSVTEEMQQQASKEQAHLMEQMNKLVEGFMKKQSKSWAKSSKAVLGEIEKTETAVCHSVCDIISLANGGAQSVDGLEESTHTLCSDGCAKIQQNGIRMESAISSIQEKHTQLRESVSEYLVSSIAAGQGHAKELEKSTKSAKGDLTKFVKATEKESKKLMKEAGKAYDAMDQHAAASHDSEVEALTGLKLAQETMHGRLADFAGSQQQQLAVFSASISDFLRDKFEEDVVTGLTPAKRMRSIPRISDVEDLKVPDVERLLGEFRASRGTREEDKKRRKSSEEDFATEKENQTDTMCKVEPHVQEDCRSPLSAVTNQ